MNAVEQLVQYWNDFYRSQQNGETIVERLLDPLKEIHLRRGEFASAYDSVMNAIGDQITYYPEAFFGFLNDDIRADVLGLFMNPGAVKHPTERWNDEVMRQYTEWKPAKYLEECSALTKTSLPRSSRACGCYLKDRHKDGCLWRWDRYDELRSRFGLTDFRFLHSFELFPFHSRKFDKSIKDHLPVMIDMPFIQLTLQAVREISEQNRVRAIVGIGKAWEDVLDTMTWQLKTSEKFEGSVRTRVIRYQSTERATPILILSRQTKNGVKYDIPPAAENYVCRILGTQPPPATIEELRPQDSRKPTKGQGTNSNGGARGRRPAVSDGSGPIELIEEVALRALALSGDSDLYAGRSVDPPKSRYVYKHLWYRNRKPWDNWLCSFHIHVHRQAEPSIVIRFGFNLNKLGWPKERVALMKSKLSEIAGPFMMKPMMGRAVFAIERKFNRDEVEGAAECLAELIPAIQQAVKEENLESTLEL